MCRPNNNQWQLYPMGTQGKIYGCIYFLCNIAITDLSEAYRNFYGKFNSIMSVLGKRSNEMVALCLLKTYCLPTLMYGVRSLTDNNLYKVNVAWNNCVRRIFSCCWRESTRPLQFFCNTLPISFLLDQRKLIFWYRMHCVDNPNLYALSRLHQNRFIAIGCKYEIIDLLSNSYVYVKEAVWRVFAGTVTL